jgi:hypothetical protein
MKRLDDKVILVTGSGRGFGRAMAYSYALEGANVIATSRTVSELKSLEKAIKTNVNNAASFPLTSFEDTSLQSWKHTIAVNLTAPFILSKAFFETMKEQGRGSIINVTSKSAEIGFLKPGEMTLKEANQMPEEVKKLYADDDSMAEAFSEAWAFLALRDAQSVTGQRFGTRHLAEFLKRNGWEAAIANWTRKLTKAVYVSYDFPESVRYQIPGGGYAELRFSFQKE